MIALMMVAIGLIVFVVGIVTGRLTSKKAVEKAVAKEIEPVCGCTHHLAFHDPNTGRCSEESENYNDAKRKYDQCGCRRYVGPEVNMGFYHPGVAFKSAAQITGDPLS